MFFPVIGKWHFKNDYDAPRGRYRHTGIDIPANKMTPIVAPFSGTLGMKRDSFWIYGDNGYAILGTHLNDDNLGREDHKGSRDVMFAPYLKPNQRVEGGQFIGYVGASGNATGPHLHFELYRPGNEPAAKRIINPWPSLHRAQHLRVARIPLPQKDLKPEKGQVRLQVCMRLTKPETHKATFILVAKQMPGGRVIAVQHVRYIKLTLSDQAVQDAGGWDALSHMSDTQTIALYLPNWDDLDGRTVDHLVMGPPLVE
ncbi:MAG TPA: M23 family metallopeptidase [Fimbriimonas sp.]|nr:M23 family metallopeptidase [Fimbriimonas sp.]